jgi:hypothetical protein
MCSQPLHVAQQLWQSSVCNAGWLWYTPDIYQQAIAFVQQLQSFGRLQLA